MILHTADWHLYDHKAFSTIVEPNMNSRLKEQLLTLAQMAEFIQRNEKDIEAMIVEGDIFGGLGKHPRDKIDKDVLHAGYMMLKQFTFHVPVHVIPGNHDIHKNTTVLNVLRDIPNLHLYTKPIEVSFSPAKHLFVPYPSGHQKDQSKWHRWVQGGDQWLITHMGFVGAGMGNFSDPEAVPIPKHPFIVTGHYHTHKMVRNVLYVGPPYQLSFADEGQPRGFVIVEQSPHGRWGFRHVPLTGPQFVTVNAKSQEDYDDWYENRLDHCYYRVVLHAPDIHVHGDQNFRCEIIPMGSEAVDLPSSGDLSLMDIRSDMESWVAALPDGVDRERILAIGKEIWKSLSG